MGGTYGVSVSAETSEVPPAHYRLVVDFEAARERIPELSAAALEEVQRLRTSGPTDDEVAKIRAARIRDRDGSTDRNTYWASELATHARMHWPLATIANHQLEATLLSKDAVQRACAQYFTPSSYVQVTMYPKGSVGR